MLNQNQRETKLAPVWAGSKRVDVTVNPFALSVLMMRVVCVALQKARTGSGSDRVSKIRWTRWLPLPVPN